MKQLPVIKTRHLQQEVPKNIPAIGVEVQKVPSPDAHDSHHTHTSRSENAHKVIGVSLVIGFVFMLLVDQLGGGHSHGGSSSGESAWPGIVKVRIDKCINFLSLCCDCGLCKFVVDAEIPSAPHTRNRITATLGLCVHAAGKT